MLETNWRMPVLDPANPDDLTAIAGWLGTKAKPARASAPKPAPRGRAPVRHRTRLTDGAEHPVTVTQLPIVRCHVCQETTAVLPSSTASETLTEHYQKRHADG